MRKKGFTLAEVLITLSIIGVVAALTISGLVREYQFHQFHVQFKKTYSEINQAVLMIMEENRGTIKGLTYPGQTNGSEILQHHLLSKIKYTKYCRKGHSIDQGCIPDYYYSIQNNKKLNGQETYAPVMSGAYIIMNNGVHLAIGTDDTNCDETAGNFGSVANPVCGSIAVDVNGIKGPNTLGLDMYYIVIDEEGIRPASSPNPNYICIRGDTSNYNDGRYCAIKVLMNEDY